MIRYAVLALGLTIASATPGATQQPGDLAKALVGLTPGKPIDCISKRSVDSVQSYGDTMLYTQGRTRKWVNETSGGCTNLNDDIMVSRSTIDQYCRGDIIETRDRQAGMTTGSCSLGSFVPYGK